MFLLFYVYDCLIFIPSKDKIDELHASLWSDLNIEDDEYLKKMLGIDLDRCPMKTLR